MPSTKYKRYPHHVRACLLGIAKNDGDWKAIAELYKVDARTAWGWIDAARASGDWSGDQKKRGGSKKKFLPVHIEYLLEELASKPELTLVQMAELVEQKFGVAITRETVRRALDARGFTVKKLHRSTKRRSKMH